MTPSPDRAAEQPVIHLRGVEMIYAVDGDRISVLDGLDLSIAPGEFVSLMGQSGSGKSTLLNVISGLLPPSAGEVLLDGTRVYELGDRERTLLRRRSIGFVFQFFNLIPSLTVFDNVALPLVIAGEDPRRRRDEIGGLLDRVGLGHRPRHYPAQLSGGELQRVTIARALVTRPRVLLADEPTGNVSARMGAEVMDLFQRVHEELNQAILLVTHNHRDAARSGRVLFMKDGRLDTQQVLTGNRVDAAHILSVLQQLDI